MEQLSKHFPIFAVSLALCPPFGWVMKGLRRHRGERISLDPPENLQNLT